MASKRRQILEALLARLQTMTHANGFDSDAGVTTFLGAVPVLGSDDPAEAVALVVGEDQSETTDLAGRTLLIQLPVAVAALAKADLDMPWLAVESIVGDVKKAVESGDRLLGGLLEQPGIVRGTVRPADREPGSTTVGAVVTYRVSYVETVGAP